MQLLDGGEDTYPRMLEAISRATRTVRLEVYSFAQSRVGARFVAALVRAAARGVDVRVVIDGWGSARSAAAIAAELAAGGCTVRIYNRLLAVLVGRVGRNHRKLLVVDDEIAFFGGINIGDENVSDDTRPGWADLAVEIRGPVDEYLARTTRHGTPSSSIRILLTGLGGGRRLRRRYIQAFESARVRIDLAHGYFLPDRGVVRAIIAAARRGVDVRLLLAGRSDVPFARAATRRLYRRLLEAGVSIHEWSGSVLHAKVGCVDGRRLLVGSFNLDPFSLANLEALVDVSEHEVVQQGQEWIASRFAESTPMTAVDASSAMRRWLLDPLGVVFARFAEAMGRVLAAGRRGRRGKPSRRTLMPPRPRTP